MTQPDAPNQPNQPGPLPGGPPQQPYQQPPYPQQPYPPQAWGAAPLPRRSGLALGLTSLVLGVLGLVVPLLPAEMTGFRAYLPFPFGIVGLVLGVLALTGNRTGKPVAVVGVVLSGLALLLGVVMLAGRI